MWDEWLNIRFSSPEFVFFHCKNGALDLCDLQLPLEALPT